MFETILIPYSQKYVDFFNNEIKKSDQQRLQETQTILQSHPSFRMYSKDSVHHILKPLMRKSIKLPTPIPTFIYIHEKGYFDFYTGIDIPYFNGQYINQQGYVEKNINPTEFEQKSQDYRTTVEFLQSDNCKQFLVNYVTDRLHILKLEDDLIEAKQKFRQLYYNNERKESSKS